MALVRVFVWHVQIIETKHKNRILSTPAMTTKHNWSHFQYEVFISSDHWWKKKRFEFKRSGVDTNIWDLSKNICACVWIDQVSYSEIIVVVVDIAWQAKQKRSFTSKKRGKREAQRGKREAQSKEQTWRSIRMCCDYENILRGFCASIYENNLILIENGKIKQRNKPNKSLKRK